MATIANLGIRFTAETTPLRRGLSKTGSILKGFAGGLASAGGMVAGFGAAAAAAAAGGLAMLTKSAMKTMDVAAKTADRLGMATEALAGLQHAAELNGAGSRTMEMGMQRMTRRVAEAARGTGEAKDAIKELGLDAKELAKLSPDQQFLRIADSMKGVRSQSDRVRLAFKLFDSEGVKLLNTLQQGSDAIREQMKDAEELGITFSAIDAKKIEMANDGMSRLWKLMKGLGITMATKISPYITAVSEALVDLGKTHGKAFGEAIDWVLKKLVGLTKGIDLARGAWATFQKTVAESQAEGAREELAKLEAQGYGQETKGEKVRRLGMQDKFTTSELMDMAVADRARRADPNEARVRELRQLIRNAEGDKKKYEFDAEKHLNAYLTDKTPKAITAKITDIAKRAAELAAKAGGGGEGGGGALAGGFSPIGMLFQQQMQQSLAHAKAMASPEMRSLKAAQYRPQSARQLDLANMALAGNFHKKQKQEFESKQLDKTNALLARLVEKFMFGGTAVMG